MARGQGSSKQSLNMVSNIQAFVYEESLGNTYKRKKSSFDFVFLFFFFGGQKWTKSIAKRTEKQTQG